MDKEIKPGRYRHYKGKDYIVYGTAKHSETEEVMVVYRTDYPDKPGNNSHWVRPIRMFNETVRVENHSKLRFEWIAEN